MLLNSLPILHEYSATDPNKVPELRETEPEEGEESGSQVTTVKERRVTDYGHMKA